MTERTLIPPKPTEEGLTNRITEVVSFPDGQSISLSLGEWHWQFIAFLDVWKGHCGYEQGILYEWHKLKTRKSLGRFGDKRMFEDMVLFVIRDSYEEWLEGMKPGEEPSFVLPLSDCGPDWESRKRLEEILTYKVSGITDDEVLIAPEPTEENLSNRIMRHINFPNGEIVRITLSEWCWEMIEYIDLRKERYGYEQGILYEWYKGSSKQPFGRFSAERVFEDATTLRIRDIYNEWLSTCEGGQPACLRSETLPDSRHKPPA